MGRETRQPTPRAGTGRERVWQEGVVRGAERHGGGAGARWLLRNHTHAHKNPHQNLPEFFVDSIHSKCIHTLH